MTTEAKLSEEDRANLRAAAEKATPGPWVEWCTRRRSPEIYTTQEGVRDQLVARGVIDKRDARFIALANPATVLALLDALESRPTPSMSEGGTELGSSRELSPSASGALERLRADTERGGYSRSWAPFRADLIALLDAQERQAWRPIESAPNDRNILAWCDHEADPWTENDGKTLTLYAAHMEGMGHAPTGAHIVTWGGGWCDTGEYGVVEAELPDWWFVAGSEFEVAANPTHWMPLPAPPSSAEAGQ